MGFDAQWWESEMYLANGKEVGP
ncbi:hypothetical protein CCACVL1_09633 [Corchorus capsularis]|uniref:Uncharacterized protein n=1 Tax=Corchorus capsularis TaxID=210143 RepID=A0A1R3IUT5_COCAP|nr:hypothetical protein CCACVL1_09633 [Corchorus capsularis]